MHGIRDGVQPNGMASRKMKATHVAHASRSTEESPSKRASSRNGSFGEIRDSDDGHRYLALAFPTSVPSGKVHDSLKLGCHGEGFDAMAVAIAASRPALTTPGELYRPM
jgi:hypothetical protein